MDEWRNLGELGNISPEQLDMMLAAGRLAHDQAQPPEDPHGRAAHTMRRRYQGVQQRDFPVLDAIANKSSILGPLAEALGPGVPEYGDRDAMIERAVPLGMLGTGVGMLRGRAPGAGVELGAGGGKSGKPPAPADLAKEILRTFNGNVDEALTFMQARAKKMAELGGPPPDYGEVIGALRAMQQNRGPTVVPFLHRMFGRTLKPDEPTPPKVKERLQEILPEPPPDAAPAPGTPLGELGRTPAPEPAPAPKPKRATSEPAGKRAPNKLDWNRAREATRAKPDQSLADIIREWGGETVANPEELARLLGLDKPKGK